MLAAKMAALQAELLRASQVDRLSLTPVSFFLRKQSAKAAARECVHPIAVAKPSPLPSLIRSASPVPGPAAEEWPIPSADLPPKPDSNIHSLTPAPRPAPPRLPGSGRAAIPPQ